MSSIIHSPEISNQKRKLTSRRSTLRDEESTNSAIAEAAAATGNSTDQSETTTALKSVVEQARQSVLAQFKEEAEAARELGRQRGLREGRLTGIEESKQNFATEIARVRSIADKLPQALRAGVDGMEDTLVEIAFEAACKILGNAAVSREGVQAMVRQAAARTLSGEKVLVRLHPSDIALLRKAGALGEELPNGAAVSWMADQRIALGGCVIETDGGELDARLETQIQRLRNELVAARKNVETMASDISSIDG
jgi:flagellar assembly protein FliH